MKRKSIDAWLIEDKNSPHYYISTDTSICGKLFDSTVFGTHLYASKGIAESVSKRCGGRVIPIKIVFKQDSLIKKIGIYLKRIIEDILDWIGEVFCT